MNSRGVHPCALGMLAASLEEEEEAWWWSLARGCPPVAGLHLVPLGPTVRPAAEAFSVAGPGSAAVELQPALEYWGALRTAAGGLGGGEDGQVPPNP